MLLQHSDESFSHPSSNATKRATHKVSVANACRQSSTSHHNTTIHQSAVAVDIRGWFLTVPGPHNPRGSLVSAACLLVFVLAAPIGRRSLVMGGWFPVAAIASGIALSVVAAAVLVVVVMVIAVVPAAALVAFEGRGSVPVVATPSAVVLLVDHPSPHLVGRLAAFLGKDHFQFASLDAEAVHLVAGLASLLGIRILDKGKALGLLRVVVPRNVHVPDLTDAPKGVPKVLVRDVGTNVSHQQRDSGNPLVAAWFVPVVASTAVGRGWTSPAPVRSIGIPAAVRRPVAVVVIVVVVRWRSAPGSSAPKVAIVVASPTIVAVGGSPVVATGGSSSIMVVIPSPVPIVASSPRRRRRRSAPGSRETPGSSPGSPSPGRRVAAASPRRRGSRSRIAPGSAAASAAAAPAVAGGTGGRGTAAARFTEWRAVVVRGASAAAALFGIKSAAVAVVVVAAAGHGVFFGVGVGVGVSAGVSLCVRKELVARMFSVVLILCFFTFRSFERAAGRRDSQRCCFAGTKCLLCYIIDEDPGVSNSQRDPGWIGSISF
mmetsp:Transcript_25352/g.69862  ORF Transcript_25352/g.69862 Transcript_25352/m.69862 type:complete len:544 (-) Transcript_25352:49-1680(-)